MGDNVYLNADRSAVVDQWAEGKKFQVPRAEAAKLGLLDTAEKPIQERRIVDHSPGTTSSPEPTAPKPKRKYTRRK